MIGKSFTELVFGQIATVLATGVSFHTKNTPLELVVDGRLQTFYFNYSLTPLRDTGAENYGVMNTGVDLTELNSTELHKKTSVHCAFAVNYPSLL